MCPLSRPACQGDDQRSSVSNNEGMPSLTRALSFYSMRFVVLVTCAILSSAPTCVLAQPVSIVARYAQALGSENAHLTPSAREGLAERLLLLSSYYQIDPRLLLAVVSVESNWRPGVMSPVGAAGYGQLMPATAAGLKVQALDPYENLDGTARYLRRMLALHASADPQTRVRLAAASYNAGPYAVKRYGGVPPYRETRNYVARVVAQWRRFSTFVNAPAKGEVIKIVSHPGPPAHRQSARSHLADHIVRPHAMMSSVRHAMQMPPSAKRPIIAEERWRPSETPAPVVRYETSHSFLSRALGIKHRVVVSPSTTSGP